jgi:hypothetical protein
MSAPVLCSIGLGTMLACKFEGWFKKEGEESGNRKAVVACICPACWPSVCTEGESVCMCVCIMCAGENEMKMILTDGQK